MNTKVRTFSFLNLLLCLFIFVTNVTITVQARNQTTETLTSVLEKADQLDLKDPALALRYLLPQYVTNKSSLQPEQKLKFLSRLTLYNLYLDNKPQALLYINQAYQVSPDLTGHDGIDILISHSTILFHEGQDESAMEKIFEAITQSKLDNNYVLLANAYSIIAWHYRQDKDNANALRYYSLAFDNIEKFNDPTELALFNTHMFSVYIDLHDANKAVELLQQAIAHFKEYNMPFDEFMGLKDLATTYTNVTETDSKQIIELYQQMISLTPSLANGNLIYYAYIGLTDTYTLFLDLEKANANWQLAQLYIKKFSDDKVISNHYLIGVRLAVAQHNSDLAHQYLSKATNRITQQEMSLNTPLNMQLLTTQIDLAVLDQNYQLAYQYQSQLLQLNKEDNTASREKIRSRLKVEFDIQQKELQNQILEKNQTINQIELKNLKQSKHIQRGITIVSVCLIIILLLFIYRQLQNSHYLKTLANTDPLTKIANRRAIFSFATKYIRGINSTNTGVLSLIIYDIDHFKSINDTFGHSIGDQVLTNIADISKVQLRTDDLLGRIGGEEFLAVLTDTSLEHALDVAERLRSAIESASIESENRKIQVTASFGVVQFGGADKDIHALFKRADSLLYQSKASGRNRISSDM